MIRLAITKTHDTLCTTTYSVGLNTSQVATAILSTLIIRWLYLALAAIAVFLCHLLASPTSARLHLLSLYLRYIMHSNTRRLIDNQSLVKTLPTMLQTRSTSVADSNIIFSTSRMYFNISLPVFTLAAFLSAKSSFVFFLGD